jgi:hypothetical protein
MIFLKILAWLCGGYLAVALGFLVYLRDTDDPIKNALAWPFVLLFMLFGVVQ